MPPWSRVWPERAPRSPRTSDSPAAVVLAAPLPAADAPSGNTPAAHPTTPVAAPLPRADVHTRIGVQNLTSTGPQSLTETQRTYVNNLVRSINQRTPLSKAKTQEDRAALADPRTVAGFRREWKELVYPLIAAKAKGEKKPFRRRPKSYAED